MTQLCAWLVQKAAEQRAASNPISNGTTGSAPTVNRKEQRRQETEEHQRLAQLRKPLQKEQEKLDKELEKLSAEKARLDAVLADAETYEEKNKGLLTESLKKQAEVNARLSEVEPRWMELTEQIEQVT